MISCFDQENMFVISYNICEFWGDWDYSSVVEYLSAMHKAPSLILNTANKGQKVKQFPGCELTFFFFLLIPLFFRMCV
jgi:hypothetical protein